MKILNKSIAVALVFAMIMSVMSFGVFAAGEPTLNLSLNASASSVVGGNTFTVTLKGASAGDDIAIGAAGIKIEYDTTKVELVTEGLSYAPFDASYSAYADNYILLNSFGLNKTATTTASDIITFTFKAKEGAGALGAAAFSLTEYEGCWGTSESADITVVPTGATVNVIEQTTISSTTDADVSVAYGSDLAAAKALFPATVKGAGTTSTGSPVSNVDVNVEWDFTNFTTAPANMDGATVEGTLKPADGVVIGTGLKATANVTYTKATDGTIANVEVTVKKKADGAALTTAADVAALDEVKAKTATTVKNTNGVEAAVAIDYTGVEFAEGSAETLNTGAAEGSVTLSANVSTDSVFYDVTGKKVNVVVTMVPAEVEDCKVSVSGTTVNSKPTVTVVIPKNEETEGTIVAGKKLVAEIKNGEKTFIAEYALTEDDVAKFNSGSSLTIKLGGFKENGEGDTTLSLKGMGFSTGDTISTTVKYDGATLLSDKTDEDGALDVKIQPTSNPGSATGTITPAPSTAYTVKVAETANGTAAVSASSAMSGETVTVTTTPAEGYVVKSIAVADALGNAVEVKESAFVMPAANVVVTVEFAEKTDAVEGNGAFGDVPADHWAAEAIGFLKDAGAINGKTETEFDPDGLVTRAEFTKMLVSILDIKSTTTTVAFTDCGADDWFTPYVAAAVESGLVNGVTETEFAPNSTISREDVCTIIGRYLAASVEIGEKELTFTDAAEVAEYAADYVAYLAEIGIVNGYADGTFAPKANITRAEAAKVLYGLCKGVTAK